jgi:adenylate kinase
MQNKTFFIGFLLFQIATLHAVKNFVLMGPPGAGKGTFADMLVKKHKYVQICPGALLRAEASKGTELGNSIKDLVEQAKPIEASIVCKVVQIHLEEALAKEQPFVLDGFPKNKAGFEFLMEFLKKHNLIATFMHFYADDKICFDRITTRLECHGCGATFNEISKKPQLEGVCDECKNSLMHRKGDDSATADYRLKEFHANIEPVIKDIKQQLSVVEVDTSTTAINYCDLLYKKISE